MSRKRKKSRASETDRSESTPSTDAVEASAGDLEATDDEIVVDLDAGLGEDSVDDLLAAAAGAISATLDDVDDAPEPDDGVDDVRNLDAELASDVDTEVEKDLSGDFGMTEELDFVGLSSEPKWLDVPEDPAPAATYKNADDDLVEISLDDDTDDTDRDRLIAEALAFVAADPEAPEGPADEVSDHPPSSPTRPDTDPVTGSPPESDRMERAAEGGDAPLTSGAYSLPPVRDNAPPPRVTADALQALTEIHTEGLARVDDDVLLDLGDPDSSEDRDRLLQSALAHAAMQEAIYRVPGTEGQPRSAKPFLVGAILALALLVTAVPPSFLTPSPPAEITAADRLIGYRVTLLLQAQQIDAFRATNGRLPRSLAELEGPLPGIRFVASNNRLYQLVLRTEDRTLIYDSATPDPAFAALADRWTTTRGGS